MSYNGKGVNMIIRNTLMGDDIDAEQELQK